MLHIVVNPATGSGRGKRIFESVKPYFDSAGVAYQVHYPGGEKRLTDVVRKLSGSGDGDRDYTDIVIIGGDGSMNDAVNGIVDFERTRIGFIPAGSGNDLARDLGIPVVSGRGRHTAKKREEIKSLVRTIALRKTARSMDIGVVESGEERYYFNISSGAGFDAETCYYVERSGMKRILNKIGLGRLVYILIALRLILKNESFRCEIHTEDGQTRVYEKCFFAACMDHRYEGGGFMFCPEASDNDGMLDICVANDISVMKFMRMFPMAVSGKHVKYKEIDIFRGREIYMKLDGPRHLHADGEVKTPGDEVRYHIHDKKLMLLM